MDKIIVILGPTSSGKSDLGIKLAKKFKGEIISADSRQVYKGMDIGTGKVSKKEQNIVPHHLLDVADPKKQFSVSQFRKLGLSKIKSIQKNNHIPFIVGGTAFYIYSLIDDLKIPEVKPNLKLRKELENKSTSQLFSILKKMDKARAAGIDKNNRPRLIRAIEIVKTTGKPVPEFSFKYESHEKVLILGITTSQTELYKKIDKRIVARLKQGMVKEVKKLLAKGLTHQKLQSFGLEYKFISLYLQGKLNYDQMVERLKQESHHFAKRQMTWFKRDPRIVWIKNYKEAEKEIKNSLDLQRVD